MDHIKKIHVVFKTHLDVGFTDLAQNVVEQYFHSYIPEAMRLAEQLQLEESPIQFVWTTGSWLIHEYLKQASEEQKKRMEEAISAGVITWHGLPFTTHSELMDPVLFDYGLSISQKLDARFGKRTIAAKMTDVPGHTKAIIPRLAKFGIRYLHLGVNSASKVPSVPDIFVWKGKDGSEVIVNYSATYGDMVMCDGIDEAMLFAHTGDNDGPPTSEEIQLGYAQLAESYPDATIIASTMEAFAERLWAIKDRFPVVYEEIGDTWIHGVASDPLKVAHYRELLRLRDTWLQEGRLDPESKEYTDFCDKLILIPEHTWGMDEKKYLTDFKNYSVKDFQAARKADNITEEAIPDKYRYLGYFTLGESTSFDFAEGIQLNKTFTAYESSFQEQREYNEQAIRGLSMDKRNEATKALNDLAPEQEGWKDGEQLNSHYDYRLGAFKVKFESDGSISSLVDEQGKIWADQSHRLGSFQYETFGIENYNHWFENYIRNSRFNYNWSDADFGKPGMEFAEPTPKHQRYSPTMTTILMRTEESYDLVQVQLVMPQECFQVHGAPREIRIDYKFYKKEKKIDAELSWLDKQAYRLPEASWFSFALKVDNPNLWKMDKMGDRISPLEVVKNGNRNLHAVNSGIYYDGSDGTVFIETLDVPLVAPGEKRLLQFDQSFAPLDGGMHFLLHNNVWGTNFKMWFEENMKFRFSINL